MCSLDAFLNLVRIYDSPSWWNTHYSDTAQILATLADMATGTGIGRRAQDTGTREVSMRQENTFKRLRGLTIVVENLSKCECIRPRSRRHFVYGLVR